MGQAPASARYLAALPGYTLFLSDTDVVMRFPGRRGELRMNVPHAHVEALDLMPGKTSYYVGSNASRWRTGIPNYGRIRYRSVYPGVDLALYGKAQQVEYDWTLAPGADPGAIRFSFAGARGIRLDENGDLLIETSAGTVRHRRPSIYQRGHGRTRHIAGGFWLERGEVGFRLGEYDHRLPLVIDPQLVFAAGFGGSGVGVDFPQAHFSYSDTGTGIATDGSGNVYVVGTTFSTDFPLVDSAAAAPSCPLGCDVRSLFVAKLAADGSALLYSTYIGAVTAQPGIAGPSGWTWPSLLPAGIAVDSAGNAFVTGGTPGGIFPFAATSGGSDAFLVELGSNGAVLASTLFGGSADDAGTSIAFGPDGFLYLAGTTQSANFPTTPGAYRTSAPAAGVNLFAMKVAPQTLKPVWSTYLGAAGSPSVGVDSAGNAYVAASASHVSVLKINPAGSQLLYTTSFGGSGTEILGGLAVDPAGNTYICGTTSSTDLPTTSGAFQATWTPGPRYQAQAAFAAKFAPAGGLSYATYLAGSSGSDSAQAIAVDAAGNAYVGGQTLSADFPVLNGIQESLYNYVCTTYTVSGTGPYGEEYCSPAGFISVLNGAGTGLVWSTFVGSGAIDMGAFGGYSGGGAVEALALDAAGNVYATGVALDFITPPLGRSTSKSVGVVKIAPGASGVQFGWDGLTNAASFLPGLPEPGGLASLFVHGLNVSGVVTAGGYPLPTEMAGVSILINGTPAPLVALAGLSSSMQQINFQVPFAANPANPANAAANLVEVRYQGTSTFIVPEIVGPGIFLLSDGTPAIQHASDYSLVTASNPARKGETIIIYLTGLGPVSPPMASGVPATGAATANCNPFVVSPDTSISIGTALYAGVTPGYVGLYQMNVQLGNLSSGNVNLFVEMNNCAGVFGLAPGAPPSAFSSNTVTLPVE